MKQKFTTTVDEKVLEEFKILAIREKRPVSDMLEELMRERLKQAEQKTDAKPS